MAIWWQSNPGREGVILRGSNGRGLWCDRCPCIPILTKFRLRVVNVIFDIFPGTTITYETVFDGVPDQGVNIFDVRAKFQDLETTGQLTLNLSWREKFCPIDGMPAIDIDFSYAMEPLDGFFPFVRGVSSEPTPYFCASPGFEQINSYAGETLSMFWRTLCECRGQSTFGGGYFPFTSEARFSEVSDQIPATLSGAGTYWVLDFKYSICY
jgi:hypothetical protein